MSEASTEQLLGGPEGIKVAAVIHVYPNLSTVKSKHERSNVEVASITHFTELLIRSVNALFRPGGAV